MSPKILNNAIKTILVDNQAKQKAKDYQKVIEKWYNPEIIRGFFNKHIEV